jgi:hypothetical protein
MQFTIKRLDDATIFRVFEKAHKVGQAALDKVRDDGAGFSGVAPELKVNYATSLPFDMTDQDLSNAAPGQFTLNRASLSLTFRTGPQEPAITFQLARGTSGSLLDEFYISGGSDTGFKDIQLQTVVTAIHQSVSSILAPAAPEDGGLIPTLGNLARGFDTTYQRTSVELSDAVKKVHTEGAQQRAELASERERLYAELAQEKADWKDATTKELETARTEIAEDRRRLDAERAKLDLSSHKDARRKQFHQLQTDLQKDLQAPVASGQQVWMRWAVFAAFIAAGLGAGWFSVASLTAPLAFGDASGTWIIPLVRTVGLTFAALAAFYGAVAWMRFFYTRDLQAQEDLRRFRNDMARASWIMDASLEIKKEQKEIIPPEWIAGVTTGLFSAHSAGKMDDAAQAMGALMGLTANASFGPEGPRFDLNKTGTKALSKIAKSP